MSLVLLPKDKVPLVSEIFPKEEYDNLSEANQKLALDTIFKHMQSCFIGFKGRNLKSKFDPNISDKLCEIRTWMIWVAGRDTSDEDLAPFLNVNSLKDEDKKNFQLQKKLLLIFKIYLLTITKKEELKELPELSGSTIIHCHNSPRKLGLTKLGLSKRLSQQILLKLDRSMRAESVLFLQNQVTTYLPPPFSVTETVYQNKKITLTQNSFEELACFYILENIYKNALQFSCPIVLKVRPLTFSPSIEPDKDDSKIYILKGLFRVKDGRYALAENGSSDLHETVFLLEAFTSRTAAELNDNFFVELLERTDGFLNFLLLDAAAHPQYSNQSVLIKEVLRREIKPSIKAQELPAILPPLKLEPDHDPKVTKLLERIAPLIKKIFKLSRGKLNHILEKIKEKPGLNAIGIIKKILPRLDIKLFFDLLSKVDPNESTLIEREFLNLEESSQPRAFKAIKETIRHRQMSKELVFFRTYGMHPIDSPDLRRQREELIDHLMFDPIPSISQEEKEKLAALRHKATELGISMLNPSLCCIEHVHIDVLHNYYAK